MQTDYYKNTKIQLGNKPLKTPHATQVCFFNPIKHSYLSLQCLLLVLPPQLGLRKQKKGVSEDLSKLAQIFYTDQSGLQLVCSSWMGRNQFSIFNKCLMFQSKKIPVKTPILKSLLKVFCNLRCTGCRPYRNIVFLSSQNRIKLSQAATKCLSYIIYI